MFQIASVSDSVLTYFKHINTEAQQKIYLPFEKNIATETLKISLNITSHKSEKDPQSVTNYTFNGL